MRSSPINHGPALRPPLLKEASAWPRVHGDLFKGSSGDDARGARGCGRPAGGVLPDQDPRPGPGVLQELAVQVSVQCYRTCRLFTVFLFVPLVFMAIDVAKPIAQSRQSAPPLHEVVRLNLTCLWGVSKYVTKGFFVSPSCPTPPDSDHMENIDGYLMKYTNLVTGWQYRCAFYVFSLWNSNP